MARKCTCIRCQAKELVSRIYPDMDERRVLLVAENMVKALRESVRETQHMPADQ